MADNLPFGDYVSPGYFNLWPEIFWKMDAAVNLFLANDPRNVDFNFDNSGRLFSQKLHRNFAS